MGEFRLVMGDLGKKKGGERKKGKNEYIEMLWRVVM